MYIYLFSFPSELVTSLSYIVIEGRSYGNRVTLLKNACTCNFQVDLFPGKKRTNAGREMTGQSSTRVKLVLSAMILS